MRNYLCFSTENNDVFLRVLVFFVGVKPLELLPFMRTGLSDIWQTISEHLSTGAAFFNVIYVIFVHRVSSSIQQPINIIVYVFFCDLYLVNLFHVALSSHVSLVIYYS